MVMPRCRGKNRFGLNRIESQLVGILVGPLPVASPVGFNPLVQINRLRRCIYRCSYEWIHLHIFSVNWVIFATQRWNPKSNGVILIQRTNVFTTMERYIYKSSSTQSSQASWFFFPQTYLTYLLKVESDPLRKGVSDFPRLLIPLANNGGSRGRLHLVWCTRIATRVHISLRRWRFIVRVLGSLK